MKSTTNMIDLEKSLHSLIWMMHYLNLIDNENMYTEEIEQNSKDYLLRFFKNEQKRLDKEACDKRRLESDEADLQNGWGEATKQNAARISRLGRGICR